MGVMKLDPEAEFVASQEATLHQSNQPVYPQGEYNPVNNDGVYMAPGG